MLESVEFVLGLGLVLLVLSDIFRTILLPRPTHHALRLGPIIGATIAPLWLRAAGRLRSREARQTLRGSLGAALLVLSLLIWIVLLFLGLGMLLHALGDSLQPRPTFSDSIYYAASAALTLGIAPATASGAARVIVMAAGIFGLASVTVVATFLLSVQSELNRREVLVLRTEVAAGTPPTGLAILETYARSGMVDQLATLFRNWEQWSAEVLHSHRANPILCHFRSADEDGEWLAVFGSVLDAASLMLATVEHYGFEAGVSAARLLLAMGGRTADDLAALLRVKPAELQLSQDEFVRARHRLTQAGYRVTTDAQVSENTFRELVSGYQPALGALCAHLGIMTVQHLAMVNDPAASEIISQTKQ
jgi:hypothetical protein